MENRPERETKNKEVLENPEYLTTQIITYIGNKRSLLPNIEAEICEIKKILGKDRLVCADVFSGSGIVSRMMKKHSSVLYVNDLENYSRIINSCYLTNKSDFPEEEYRTLHKTLLEKAEKEPREGIIAKNYAPKDDSSIKTGERVFYTHQNAVLIDTYRALIEETVPENLKNFFLAPLLSEASIHVNTSGVFKGFYKNPDTGLGCFGGKGKNALTRILGKVELKTPVFSNFNSEVKLFQLDALKFAETVTKVSEEENSSSKKEMGGHEQDSSAGKTEASGSLLFDIAYLDPPYNQHPYGSNYFMLNLILKNKIDCDISKVSGITKDWNRSDFNRPYAALKTLEKVIEALDAKYIIISYNSEGFIKFNEMKEMLEKYGKLKTTEIPYHTFRGSRNLNERSLTVKEFLFILEK